MNNKLPAGFVFSQSSFRDYLECPRRFELRYMQGLKWPAAQSEPIMEQERRMKLGSHFHQMVQQHLLNVPVDAIDAQMMDIELREWWNSYVNAGFVATLPAQHRVEIILTMPFVGYRLLAKYDLLAVSPGERAVIVDWKTAKRKPSPTRLENAIQTTVYRYLLVAAGATLNGGVPFSPEEVEMVYWFTSNPDEPERFAYNTAQYEADEQRLHKLIAEIEARTQFDLTTDTRRCQFCTYRSLCERGIRAGDLDELDNLDLDDEDTLNGDDLSINFDFDQIAEVEF